MHEYSVVRALLDQIEEQAAANDASHVTRVSLSLGELAGVDPELLATAFDVFTEGTIAAGASLAITRVAAKWTCPRCDEAISRGAQLRCPRCAIPARLLLGDELILDRIEMEVRDVS